MSDLKFTSVEDTPEMVQAKVSNKLATDVSVSFVKESIINRSAYKKNKATCCSHLINALTISYHHSTEAVQGERRKHEAQLHAER